MLQDASITWFITICYFQSCNIRWKKTTERKQISSGKMRAEENKVADKS